LPHTVFTYSHIWRSFCGNDLQHHHAYEHIIFDVKNWFAETNLNRNQNSFLVQPFHQYFNIRSSQHHFLLLLPAHTTFRTLETLISRFHLNYLNKTEAVRSVRELYALCTPWYLNIFYLKVSVDRYSTLVGMLALLDSSSYSSTYVLVIKQFSKVQTNFQVFMNAKILRGIICPNA